MSNRLSHVPTVVTLDVHDQPRLGYYLDRSAEILAERRISATYFVPATTFKKYEAQFERLTASHDVACHGLYHDQNAGEPYDVMPPSVQSRYIREATDILSAGLGRHPQAFRAPAFRISGTALRILSDNGYEADTSVNSGRIGLSGSYWRRNPWLSACRLPYHPGTSDPFHYGELPIWEIPVSALLLPLTANGLAVLGVRSRAALVDALYRESRSIPKPIVYGGHPEDICRDGPLRPREKFRLGMLVPDGSGFPIRTYLAARDPMTVWHLTSWLLSKLERKSSTEFISVSSYIDRCLR